MSESVYKVIELVGSTEVVQLDMHLEDGKIKAYRAKLKVSFKYHGEDDD